MNKKNKQIINIAKENVKILKSGKVKIKKGEKIQLKPFISESVENTVCSRIDNILTKENIVVENKNVYTTNINTNLTTIQSIADVLSRISNTENETQTIVYIINKKEYSEIFDMLHSSIVGELMRSSTLASVYSEFEADWSSLNKNDKSAYTNVLFIPKIYVFLDPNTGKIRKMPYTINLLIVAEPSAKYQAIEKPTPEEVVNRAINDALESAVVLGTRNLIISPFANKIFRETCDPRKSASLWGENIITDRVIKNIKTISFAIADEDLYIIFMKNRQFPDVLSGEKIEVGLF